MWLPRSGAEGCRCIPTPTSDGDLPAQSVGLCMRKEKGTSAGHSWDVRGNVGGGKHAQSCAGDEQERLPVSLKLALLSDGALSIGEVPFPEPTLDLLGQRSVLGRIGNTPPLRSLEHQVGGQFHRACSLRGLQACP